MKKPTIATLILMLSECVYFGVRNTPPSLINDSNDSFYGLIFVITFWGSFFDSIIFIAVRFNMVTDKDRDFEKVIYPYIIVPFVNLIVYLNIVFILYFEVGKML